MSTETLSLAEKLHYWHRFLRYRMRSEPDTIRFIKEEFEPGGLALDIGANKGVVTYFLSKQAGPDGRVLAFEPQPEMEALIAKVARSFGLKNIEIHSLGLSDHNGTATLYRGAPGDTANLVGGAEWQTEKVEVKTLTLDSFFEAHRLDRLDFVKCDVDGFEAAVLRGAENVLKRFYPKALIEIDEPRVLEVAEIMKNFGYDDGVFWQRGKRHPTIQTFQLGYRHPESKWRNFLFCKRK